MAEWSLWKAAVGVGIGLTIAAGGYALGGTSHTVTYQSVGPAQVQDYIVSDTHYYVELKGDATLYSLTKSDFSPSIPENIFNGPNIQFTYNPTSTTSIDVTSVSGSHFSGDAYTVVAVTANQSTPAEYATTSYKQQTKGYTVNLWPWADGIIGFGGLLVLLSLIVPAHIMIMIVDALIGSVALPGIFLVFGGIFVPNQWSDFGQAFLTNIVVYVGAALVGLVGGFVVGIFHAIFSPD